MPNELYFDDLDLREEPEECGRAGLPMPTAATVGCTHTDTCTDGCC